MAASSQTEAPPKAGITPQQPSEVRSGTFTPKGVVAFGQGTQLEEFAVGHDHLGPEYPSMGKPDPVAQWRPAVADQIGDG